MKMTAVQNALEALLKGESWDKIKNNFGKSTIYKAVELFWPKAEKKIDSLRKKSIHLKEKSMVL